MHGEACSTNGDGAPFGISCRFGRIAAATANGAPDITLTWSAPPPRLTPSHSYVDLWLAHLDAADRVEPLLAAELSARERARAERFRFAVDRRRFVGRRAWLRRLLAAYLGTTPTGLLFDTGPMGKPFVKAPARPRVSFNLSHSSGWALAAVTAHRDVGVDIEALPPCPSSVRLPTQGLADDEQTEFAELPPRLRPGAILRGWTCKEALSKATGLGLDLCTHSVSGANERRLRGFVIAGRSWQLFRFVPHPDTVAALVVEE
jgi:4'-phosphopantetheinyl transferase